MRIRKPNNQGLSLLELLLAVIVIAIIVVPFLNSFVISARSNARAAKTHRATLAAQNIMEGFKADSLENIAWQTAYPERDFHVIDKKLIKGNLRDSVFEMTAVSGGTDTLYQKSITIEELKASHPGMDEKALKKEFEKIDKGASEAVYTSPRRGSIFSFDGGAAYQFLNQTDGKYYFAIKGVEFQGSRFDAKICLDAEKYRKNSPLDPDLQYNDKKTVNIIGMDVAKDAIIVQKASLDQEAAAFFQSELTPGEYVDENEIRRDITVKIRVTGNEKPIHRVSYEFKYTYTKNGHTWPSEQPHMAFDNSETGEPLRAVYLCYFPLYSSKTGGAGATDTITIDNASDNGKCLPIDLYIVKQAGNQIGLTANENAYKVLVNIKDNPLLSEMAQQSLRTNYEYNMANIYNSSAAPGSEIPLVGKQPEYRWNGTVIAGTEEVVEEKLKLNRLTDDTPEDRIYEINVSIYEEGAADSYFPEADKLAEINGERNN